MKVSISPSDSTIHEGDNITLTCTSDSNPPTSWYKWERRQREETETLESSERDLTLYRITHRQEGVYSCEAGNSVSANRSDVCRIMFGKLERVRLMKYLGADTDQEILRLAVTSPSYLQAWAERLLFQDVMYPDRMLSLVHLERSLLMKWFLLLSVFLPSACDKPRDFQIVHSVNGVARRDLTSVNERDTVNISCTSQNSDPAVSGYSWYRLTQNKPVSGQILLFESISKDDSGDYQCEARNNVGTGRSHTINIKVQYAPTSVRITFPPSVRAGVWTSLSCQSDGHPAAVSYHWRKVCPHGSMSLCSGNQWTSQCSFYASVEDVGCEITCTAGNTVGEKESDPIRLDIQYGPRDVTIVRSEPQGEVKEGDRVTLTCNSRSNPGARYTWYKDNVNTAVNRGTGNILTIRSITPTESGDYYCKAENVIGEQTSKSFRIEVLYGPRNVEIISEDTVKEGTEITLTCRGEANPPVHTYSWRKMCNGQRNNLRENTDTIRIQPTRDDASCSYICRARNYVISRDSTPKHINVQYGPGDVTIVRSEPQGEVKEGDRVTLTCNSGSNPGARYTWYKDNVNTSVNKGTGNILTIRSITPTESGDYYCKAENVIGKQTSKSFRIEVFYGPRNVEIISEDTVKEGTEITLTCRGEANPPVHTYSWRKMCNGQRNNLRENTDTIRIQPTRDDASCSYICRARNSVISRDSTPKHINIQYGPGDVTIVRSEPQGEVKEGDRVTLTCNSRSNPGARYTWYKDNVNTAVNKGTGNILTIRSITPTESGDYYCKAENVIGKQASKSFRIEMLYSPRNMQVSVSPSDSAIHEGDNITLSCTSDSNPPTSWYKWELRQGEEAESLESSERDLTLYRVTHKQEGVYSCEAGNTVGANSSDGRRITFGNSRGESLHVILILGIRAGIFIVAVVLTVAGVCVSEGQTVKGS
ncbi:cell adhesion molecule CEACAM5-like [Chiloscyllium punctatum]|uniref:cell adhesion molecule CEACAM5-like n=1 Tax=Chiloscyllium punctatum TaxID=137246 RepID=UPI003B63927C